MVRWDLTSLSGVLALSRSTMLPIQPAGKRNMQHDSLRNTPQRSCQHTPARHAEDGTSLGVSCRDVGMSWPLSAAARASVGLSRGSAEMLNVKGAGAGAGAGAGVA